MHPLQQPLQGGYRAAGAEPLTAGGVAQGGVEQAGALGARLQRLGQHQALIQQGGGDGLQHGAQIREGAVLGLRLLADRADMAVKGQQR